MDPNDRKIADDPFAPPAEAAAEPEKGGAGAEEDVGADMGFGSDEF